MGLRAMEKRPAPRSATGQEVADALRRFLEDKPIQAKRPTPWQRLMKWARQHQPLVQTAAAFLVLAVIGLAAATVLIWREKARAEANLRAAEEQTALVRSHLYAAELTPPPRAGRAGARQRVTGLLSRHLTEPGWDGVRGSSGTTSGGSAGATDSSSAGPRSRFTTSPSRPTARSWPSPVKRWAWTCSTQAAGNRWVAWPGTGARSTGWSSPRTASCWRPPATTGPYGCGTDALPCSCGTACPGASCGL